MLYNIQLSSCSSVFSAKWFIDVLQMFTTIRCNRTRLKTSTCNICKCKLSSSYKLNTVLWGEQVPEDDQLWPGVMCQPAWPVLLLCVLSLPLSLTLSLTRCLWSLWHSDSHESVVLICLIIPRSHERRCRHPNVNTNTSQTHGGNRRVSRLMSAEARSFSPADGNYLIWCALSCSHKAVFFSGLLSVSLSTNARCLYKRKCFWISLLHQLFISPL